MSRDDSYNDIMTSVTTIYTEITLTAVGSGLHTVQNFNYLFIYSAHSQLKTEHTI